MCRTISSPNATYAVVADRRGVAVAAVLFAASQGDLTAQIRVDGAVEVQAITYVEPFASSGRMGRAQIVVQPELKWTLGSRGEFFASVELRADGTDDSRRRAFVEEAYLDLYLGPMDLQIGRQILAWGQADAVNPTDFFSAWDFADILDADNEKLGQTSIRATWYSGDWSVEAVATPRTVSSRLPAVNGRWWPDQGPTIPNPFYPNVGEPELQASYRYGSESFPDGRAAWGVRAAGVVGRFDVSISGYAGPGHLPILVPDVVADPISGSADITLVRRAYGMTALGVDIATAFGSWGFHGEGAVYTTEDGDGTDPSVEDPFIRYVVGADRRISNGVFGRDIFILIEWIQDVRLPNTGPGWAPSDLNHLFRKTLFAYVDLTLGDFSTLGLRADSPAVAFDDVTNG